MITINLLPPADKKEYKMELNRRLVVFYSVGVLVILGIFIGLLFSIEVYMSIQRDSLSQQIELLETSPKSKEIRSLELSIRDFSTLLNKIKAVKNTLLPLHPLFGDLASVMPPGVYLSTFSLDSQTSKASLTGFAPGRAEVLGFKGNLEKLSWVKRVESPLSNLIKEKNINFSFNLDVKLK